MVIGSSGVEGLLPVKWLLLHVGRKRLVVLIKVGSHRVELGRSCVEATFHSLTRGRVSRVELLLVALVGALMRQGPRLLLFAFFFKFICNFLHWWGGKDTGAAVFALFSLAPLPLEVLGKRVVLFNCVLLDDLNLRPSCHFSFPVLLSNDAQLLLLAQPWRLHHRLLVK